MCCSASSSASVACRLVTQPGLLFCGGIYGVARLVVLVDVNWESGGLRILADAELCRLSSSRARPNIDA